ncbi:succinylglutamate desuccinylase [Rheinheimera riviphila]|uniref:Succinylglutamate desuccinylase n=1 Tax=Rheinheimera riviphila TaxID=1834037 RepID=A0A437R2A4_9GAMM|nr:succinylglutamate desuccinylase [Rheinheimera riviphila]RVU40852.1 succinylglutamate desuccinylase [Rheinheimera riviphila]
MLPAWLSSADFLAFTLANPEQLPSDLQPLTFQLKNGTDCQIWDTGIICFTPQTYGNNDIVLSCGVHGNETAPIEICAALVQDILLERLQLSERVLFLFGNPPAINAGKRELIDNMNRFFSGAHGISNDRDIDAITDVEISFEKRRCARLEQYVSRFYQAVPAGRERCLYDLHTAIRGSQFEKFAVYPFLHGKPWSEAQFSLLAACDIPCFLLMQTPATTFSYYAAQTHGAHAFTLELGKARPLGENDMSRFAKVADTLRALISGADITTKPFVETDFQLFEVYRAINKQTEAFELCFATSIENFTQLPLGTLLAKDADIEYRVEQPGEAIIFPNANVALGQRAMLMVKPVSIIGQTA